MIEMIMVLSGRDRLLTFTLVAIALWTPDTALQSLKTAGKGIKNSFDFIMKIKQTSTKVDHLSTSAIDSNDSRSL